MIEENLKTESDNDDDNTEYIGLPYRLFGFLILFPTLILLLLWNEWGIFTLQSLFVMFIIISMVVTSSVYFGAKIYKAYVFRFRKE